MTGLMAVGQYICARRFYMTFVLDLSNVLLTIALKFGLLRPLSLELED